MQSDKSRFHNYSHAVDYDRRAARSDIRSRLTPMLIEALGCRGEERVLDVATGTGRFAGPVAESLEGGRIVGLDEAVAMLRVGREHREKDPIPGFFPVAGRAEAFPFCANAFDRVFTAFALHHFRRPALAVGEAHRVLKPGGRCVILDPVLVAAEDSLDRAIHDRIKQLLSRSHGDHFQHHSAQEIHDLLTGAGFDGVRAHIHSFAVDQEGADGIPTGRHWLEIAEEIQRESPEIRRRFEEKYFQYEKRGETVHVKGSFAFALVCGEKR